MAVTLVVTGGLRECTGGLQKLEVAAGPTVKEMLGTLSIRPELVAAVMRDGELVSQEYRPEDGETVVLVAVLGGG